MSLISKLKFDKHHHIERFGVSLIALSICMSGVVGVGAYSYIEQNRENLSNQAIYTKAFVSSKSNIQGKVSNVFISKDKKKAFLLLKFDNINSVSLNAKNYKAFLTGSDSKQSKTDLLSKPFGSIYTFGSSGYMGFLFVNNAGFKSQILDLVVRNNSQITSNTDVTSDMMTLDEQIKKEADPANKNEKVEEEPSDVAKKNGSITFDKFDQFKVFFNPGATEAVVADVLSKDVISPVELYKELVLYREDEILKKKLAKVVDALDTSRAAVSEYNERFKTITVGGAHIVTPDNVNKILEDKIEVKKNLDGSVSSKTFIPKYVLPGGFEFDWQNTSIDDGYLKQVNKDNLDVVEFLKNKSKEAIAKDMYDFTNFGKWRLDNGTAFDDYIANTSQDIDTGLKDVNNNITSLQTAVNSYLNAKKLYQIDYMRKLLDLEITLGTIDSATSVNAEKKAVTLY